MSKQRRLKNNVEVFIECRVEIVPEFVPFNTEFIAINWNIGQFISHQLCQVKKRMNKPDFRHVSVINSFGVVVFELNHLIYKVESVPDALSKIWEGGVQRQSCEEGVNVRLIGRVAKPFLGFEEIWILFWEIFT